jgi:hypothetical protein
MRNLMLAALALALAACTRPNDLTMPEPQADLAPAPSAPDMGRAPGADLAGAPQLGDMAQLAAGGDLAQAPAGDMAQAPACGGAGQPCCYGGGASGPGAGSCSDGACMGRIGGPDTAHGGFLCGGPATERCVPHVASNCGVYPFSGCTIDGLPNGSYCSLAESSGPEGVQGGQCQPCTYP